MLALQGVKEIIRNSIEEVVKALDLKDKVREEIIKSGRDVVRESGYVITSLHSGNIEEANKHLEIMRDIFVRVWEVSGEFPELRYSGLMNNIASEYVEAVLFYGLVTDGRLPSLKELGVTPVQYVQGLLDVVGELKRYVLDKLRNGELNEAEAFFKVAEAIYESTKALDFPEPVLPGVRRKVDVARSVVESMRALLTDLRSRSELVRAIEEAKRILGK
ncbi:MAG: haloacid dehalogenase [Desulfurococcales archaeon]|nr:haloacid dehalogenase [Desulfurococcales archaeon]